MSERKRKINLFLHSIEYLIAFGIFFLFGIIHTLALETKTLYATNSSGTLSNSNKYTYGFINSGGVQTTSSASVNTTINGRALALIYYIYEPVVLNKTYTMEINFMGNDLINTFTSSMVEVATCNGEVCNDNAIVSVTKSSPSGMSNKLTIEFNPITSGSIILVNLSDKTREFYITGLYNQQTFGIKSVTLDSTNQNQDIIDNQTNNTNNIINNNNSNTQEIINNQNENTHAIINAQYTCKTRSITLTKYIEYKGSYVSASGAIGSASNYSVTEYIKIVKNSPYTINLNYPTNNRYCLYDNNLNLIQCPSYSGIREINFNSGDAEFIRFTIRTDTDAYTSFYGGNICLKYSQEQTNAINDLNDSINDDDIGDATQDGADFILDFDTNTFGLTSIVTAPLNLIQSLTSSSCSELELPLPFLNNKKLKLPCMTTIYQNTFGSLFTMYQTITFGIIAYWVCVRIFNQVKDFKNPEHDEIEVVDL